MELNGAHRRASPLLVWLAWVLGAALVVIYLCRWTPAAARDLGQWENADPAIGAWFRSLKQPDEPMVPCCGEADAYYADKSEVKDGQVIAIITDDRDDKPLMRPHVPVGTRVVVPPNKMMNRGGNPSGHTVIFLSPRGDVYCYVTGTLS